MKRKIPIKKLADAAGRHRSAKQNYNFPPLYRNFPLRQLFFRKIIVPRTKRQNKYGAKLWHRLRLNLSQ